MMNRRGCTWPGALGDTVGPWGGGRAELNKQTGAGSPVALSGERSPAVLGRIRKAVTPEWLLLPTDRGQTPLPAGRATARWPVVPTPALGPLSLSVAPLSKCLCHMWL